MTSTTTTAPQPPRRVGRLHPRRLSKMTAAIAALAGALSVIVGVLAAQLAPHGLRGLAVSLHIAREPLILKVAAGIGTVAVTTAVISGLLHFYLWWQERNLE
jgi:uncharacterized membrane protein (DUF441 family)